MSHLTRPVDRTSDNPAQDPRTWKQIQTLKGREKSPTAKAVVTGFTGNHHSHPPSHGAVFQHLLPLYAFVVKVKTYG